MRRHGFTWAISPRRLPGFSRLCSLGSGVVDGGGVNGLASGTAVGEVEEFLHTDPPLLVDLGVVGARRKLNQGLGSDEVVVTSLRVCGEERVGLASGSLLTLAGAGAVALLPGSGILVDVAVDALFPS